MTREKFIETLKGSAFRECRSDEEYALYEKDGIYLFLLNDRVTDALYGGTWEIPYQNIVLIRSRRGYLEIECKDGTSVSLTAEEEIEIGCMG